MELIDTHCHLNYGDAFPDVPATVRLAQAAGVSTMLVVGLNGESSQHAVRLAEENEGVYAIVGLHPNYAVDYHRDHLRPVEALLDHPKVVALGEIGLDYKHKEVPAENMRASTLDQLDIAAERGKPVVFHCREAYPDLLDLLEKRPTLPYLFHCFAGSVEDARRAMAMDAYFGVDGPITYPKADELREVIRSLPRDRILLETDSPFLPPQPYRGKPNQPAYLVHTNEGLAQALGIRKEESARLTTENARRFFGI
ncbi:MAG: TatD family hydrolase [Armatimonadetes bacterium]|nr:TatD family hydrolase [Armatimonadota bacterium]